MARPKEFDGEAALGAAIALFSQHGFEGTSTEALLRAMKISRQSLYDTFGDKRQLYLAALRRYNQENVADFVRAMMAAPTPLTGVEYAFMAFIAKAVASDHPSCLGVSAICEFGRADAEIASIGDASAHTLAQALKTQLTAARAAGEMGTDVDVPTAAAFLGATLAGLKVSARAGADADTLRRVARLALKSLK
ncbi:TetR/AcrR family transcriptional regulator [Nitrospirillum amazonense]|uniref:TetR family transcriptional regulator n=1 Tax=Nitrospirillum amazonense TaxID=28077 RepID=A0A560JAV7_9PROT|nr:TetR/AcrR family transcriptional regulator [Nitrospirillum amazonense]MDG3442606.1 TetR/AcrR family transcriptional regulator [Nitrospirillum amazonense]TWB68322.1 TetR family transcriptional regulator [Nitrospirillum amazonense]